MSNLKDFKKAVLMTFVIGLSFVGNLKAFATENVLQAIQIEGVKDSYNITLRSDDTAEMKKTIQAPNKMLINLKGVRASKSINTIYNNTATVDSVVVVPTGDDSVKILIQANNVSNANVQFDTLKTPLGVLGTQVQEADNSIVLSKPVESYKPIYDKSVLDEDSNSASTLGAIMASPEAKSIKKALKNDKLSFLVIFGLFTIIIINSIKTKNNDSELKIGLSQGLKERELGLSRNMQQGLELQRGVNIANSPLQENYARTNSTIGQATLPIAGANYGLKAYQNNSRSPYMSNDSQRRPNIGVPVPQASFSGLDTVEAIKNSAAQPTMQRPMLKPAAPSTRPKTANIDSMKFLESMTKIYEKNGRSDLAQGLKSNMKKAKANIA